ncbi:MAG: hypothetical protein ABJL44_12345 [Algibacter sp.]
MNLTNDQSILKDFFDLFTSKLILNFLFIGILFLDALGAIFPQYLNRQITIFIPVPLMFLIYLLNSNKKSILFMVSTVLTFIGTCKFNNPYQEFQSLGLILLSAAFFIYFIILFKEYNTVNIKTVVKYGIVILILAIVPLMFYIEGIKKMMIFNHVILYLFMVVLFIFSTVILYMKSRTKRNRLLLFSAISIVVSCYVQGYNLFMEDTNILEFLAVISFNLTHYFMCWYLIKSSETKEII